MITIEDGEHILTFETSSAGLEILYRIKGEDHARTLTLLPVEKAASFLRSLNGIPHPRWGFRRAAINHSSIRDKIIFNFTGDCFRFTVEKYLPGRQTILEYETLHTFEIGLNDMDWSVLESGLPST